MWYSPVQSCCTSGIIITWQRLICGCSDWVYCITLMTKDLPGRNKFDLPKVCQHTPVVNEAQNWWLELYCLQIILYLDTNRISCMPETDWCILLVWLNCVVDFIIVTFQILQGMITLIPQQAAHLIGLCMMLSIMCTVKAPFSPDKISGRDTDAFLFMVNMMWSCCMHWNFQGPVFCYGLTEIYWRWCGR